MRKHKVSPVFETFILDLDGVFTNGSFLYNSQGKQFKAFGADDHDAIRLLSSHLDVQVVTADSRGFDISYQRVVNDMKLPLTLIGAEERANWVQSHFNASTTIYMGDGILDPLVFRVVAYSIAPSNALLETKKAAKHVTNAAGGERAVAESCLHIAKELLKIDLFESLKK